MRRPWFVVVASLALLWTVTGTAAAEQLSPSGSFLDDDGNIHEAAIEAIAAEGVTRGCNPPANTYYCPRDSVTRGQMAAFLVRALGLPPSTTDFFLDDDDSVFEADIQALRQAGITRGCNPPANDRFCPGGTVTRGQMAAFLTRAFGYGSTSQDFFADDDVSIFEADINRIAAAGVTKGCNPPTNSDYCPDAGVRRDQMASFLARALELPHVVLPTRMNLVEDFDLDCYEQDGGWVACFGEGVWPAHERFYIRHGYSWMPDRDGDEPAAFLSPGTRFRLFFDGTLQDLASPGVVEVGDELWRTWTKDYPDGVGEPEIILVGEWWWDGGIELQIQVLVSFE